jgi:hypothetical protein
MVSLLLVWHLAAVFLAPMSVPPSSQLVAYVAQQTFMQWYLDALYLNHGYFFFAPNAGGGHLIYYDVYDQQGNAIKQAKFPDWDLQWPRLWYHRHFMLAEQAGSPGDDPERQRRSLEAYARQLLRQFNGESIRVRWVEHQAADPSRITPPIKLDAPETYKLLMEVVQRRSDLGPEPPSKVTTHHAAEPDMANRWIGVRR